MTASLCQLIRAASQPLKPIPTGQDNSLRPLPGIRAVLFDIYGTLFVSGSGDIGTTTESARGRAVGEAFCEMFEKEQGDAMDAFSAFAGVQEKLGQPDERAALVDAVGRAVVGRFVDAIQGDHSRKRAAGVEFPEVDIVDIWRNVVATLAGAETAGSGIDFEQLAVRYELLTNPVWPMPGLAETLDRLSAADRLLGIISNAQFYTPLLFPALLDRSLDDLAFDPEMQYYSYRFGEAKPGETLYRHAVSGLAAHGITPAEALYVGNDMLNDITPASRCGFRTALFAGDRRSLRLREDDDRVAGVLPDLVVTDLATLPDCILKT